MGIQEVRQFNAWVSYELAADGQVRHRAQLEIDDIDLADSEDEPSQVVFAAGDRVLSQMSTTLGFWGPNWAARAITRSGQAPREWVSVQIHALLEAYDDATACLMGHAIIARSSRGHLLAMERGEVVPSVSHDIHFESGTHDAESAPSGAEIEATLRDLNAACSALA